jgi:hypothetical protein
VAGPHPTCTAGFFSSIASMLKREEAGGALAALLPGLDAWGRGEEGG